MWRWSWNFSGAWSRPRALQARVSRAPVGSGAGDVGLVACFPAALVGMASDFILFLRCWGRVSMGVGEEPGIMVNGREGS